MMKILVLTGKNGSGKTTSIREMVETLTKNATAKFVCKKDEERFRKNKDFVVPLLYDGFLIAVSSYGDSKPDLTKPYDNYKDYADVFVCASHPEGSAPYEVVKGWKQSHTVNVIPINGTGPKTFTQELSETTAKELCAALARMVEDLKEEQK